MSKTRTRLADQSISSTVVPAVQRIVSLVYRVDDATTAFGVSDTEVWSLIREGRLSARKLDGSTIIRHEDLTTFVRKSPGQMVLIHFAWTALS